MSDMSTLLAAIGDLREDIGGLRADVKHHDRRFDEIKGLLASHITDDNAVTKRVTHLEHARSRFTGLVAGVSAVSTLITAGIAYAVQHLPFK